jgi:hypothetical protein
VPFAGNAQHSPLKSKLSAGTLNFWKRPSRCRSGQDIFLDRYFLTANTQTTPPCGTPAPYFESATGLITNGPGSFSLLSPMM